MQPEIIVAIIVLTGTVITSIVGAYVAVRTEGNKTTKAVNAKLGSHDVKLAVVTTKVDTLWEIYAEDAIRQARTSGMVATRSPLAPTEVWKEHLSAELTEQIEADAIVLSEQFESPYDIAIEIWHKYKYDLLSTNSSMRALWGTVLIVSMNAMGHVPR